MKEGEKVQEGILQIGNAVLSEGDMLLSLVQELKTTRKNKKLYVMKINFNTGINTLNIDVTEEMGEKTTLKYLFLGKSGGPASPQWFSSSTTVSYFLTETFFNLKNKYFDEELNTKINNIFNNYYVDLGKNVKNKYRYVLDLKKFGISEESVEDIYQNLKNENQEDKKITDRLGKILEQYIKEKYDLKFNEIGLFTILIDGVPLCDFQAYREKVKCEKLKFENKKSNENYNQYCSMCGKDENLTDDLTGIQIKFYTTNQVIFSSNLSRKNYSKNMILCQNCLNKLLAGESYIKNNLSTNLAGFSVYLVPHFVYGEPLSKEELDYISENIQNSFNTVKSFKSIEEMRTNARNSILSRDEKSFYLLNLIFYKSAQASTKVQKLIKDVDPSIFDEINYNSTRTYELAKSILSNKWKTGMNLGSIYYLIPVKIVNGEPKQYKSLLSLYDALFTRRNIQKSTIIENVIKAVNVIYFEKEGFNINSKYNSIYSTVLNGNLCIEFMRYMGCMKEEMAMDTEDLKLKDHIKNYIENMKYNEQETAMFLLGYLIGEIGNAQYRRLHKNSGENNTDSKKPILNKLNYSGIDKNKIIRLTTEVFGKMNQEKIRHYNEVIFNELKRLLDMNIKKWKMNKHENLFYVLSGYSYNTARAILNNKKKEEVISDEQ
ncbi:TIGR02556 family CRISPR-associated protein [Clostridium sp. BJN0013]|uniref:TIGR02556 family CRISPR-associated protein n=1 Tax=Clostridium sp. BJN0013 TaxID=3236840 RepID=UPI0034C6B065